MRSFLLFIATLGVLGAHGGVVPPKPIKLGMRRHVPKQKHSAAAEMRRLEHNRRLAEEEDEEFVEKGPIYGDFRDLAYFYVDVMVGVPPQTVSVITDTGSSLMAFPCAGCSTCGKHQHAKYDPKKSTTSAPYMCGSSQCSYSQSYQEGSSLRGKLWKDRVWLGDEHMKSEGRDVASSEWGIQHPFGCHTSEGGLFKSQLADGIIGMSQGKDMNQHERSFVVALLKSGKVKEKTFAMCMKFHGGSLTLGGYDESTHTSNVSYFPLEPSGSFYKVHVTDLQIGSKSLGISAGKLNEGSPGSIVDSGTSFVYIPSDAHRAFSAHIASYCHASTDRCVMKKTKPPSGEFLCYIVNQESSLSPAEQLATFPDFTIKFKSGVSLVVPPRNYLIKMSWDGNAYCAGVYNNGAHTGTVIGANSMLDHDFIFDIAQRRIGIATANCDMPSSAHLLASPSPQAKPSPTSTPSKHVDPSDDDDDDDDGKNDERGKGDRDDGGDVKYATDDDVIRFSPTPTPSNGGGKDFASGAITGIVILTAGIVACVAVVYLAGGCRLRLGPLALAVGPNQADDWQDQVQESVESAPSGRRRRPGETSVVAASGGVIASINGDAPIPDPDHPDA